MEFNFSFNVPVSVNAMTFPDFAYTSPPLEGQVQEVEASQANQTNVIGITGSVN